jgi:hypothetical protein
MAISLKTQKTLWGRAASRCAMCKQELAMDATGTDDESLVGEACHIVGQSEDGPRGKSPLTLQQRDKYANLILLCNVHHKQVDDQHQAYTVEQLHEVKAKHEAMVREKLNFDAQKQREEETWAGYIDEWAERIQLNDWKLWASDIMCHGLPSLSDERKAALEDVRPWLLSRVWPTRHPQLQVALLNFRVVAQDVCLVFNEHAERTGNRWQTRKFYRSDGDWSQERESKLLASFDGHVGLVQDLMLELTRAANYVCDKVRETIVPYFRLKKGVCLLEGGPYGDLRFKTYRVEYRGAERVEHPYPGLAKYKTVRFTRDIWFGHEDDPV